MSNVKSVIIAAAGMGKRLGLDMPKCLLKLGPKMLIEYQLDLLKDIPNIYMIVGFRAEEVIEHVSKIRQDVVFIMNHHYSTTQTLYSLQLAAKFVKEPYVFIDGDLYLSPKDFAGFLSECKDEDIIGITDCKSEESVCVELDENNMIINFSREIISKNEWLGLAYFKNIDVSKHVQDVFVFNVIEKYLPLKSVKMTAYEIDTIQDLELASEKLLEHTIDLTQERELEEELK